MQPSWTTTSIQRSSCQIWDQKRARFNECFFPVLAGATASVAVLLLLGRLLQPVWLRIRPQWTKPFVEEEHSKSIDNAWDKSSAVSRRLPLVSLLACCVVGLTSSAYSTFSPQERLYSQLLAASWAIAIVLVTLERPRQFSLCLLLCFGSIFVCASIILLDGPGLVPPTSVPYVLNVTAAFITILVLFIMPMRNPATPTEKIGIPGGEPTNELRSPEDNLTLWQWCSVSWLGRLISKAGKGQLNDEDVWSLGFQFQHRQLHDNFRQLRGSVVRKLLAANALDMMIATTITVIDQAAKFSVPVFLQQLLQSWEDPGSTRSATTKYAILQLIARLVAAQTSTLSLWFARRCYERSRGEMITMLYEKTLSRKIVTMQEEVDNSIDESTSNVMKVTGAARDSKPPSSVLWKYASTILIIFTFPFTALHEKLGLEKTREQVKKPASMGKILNLMRHDVYEVAQRFWEIDELVSTPLGIVWSVILVWKLIGPSCLVGVLTLITAQITTFLLAKLLLSWERIRRTATDARLQATSQTIESIRHLRWYGWQQTWIDRVMSERQRELNLTIVTSIFRVFIDVVNTFASGTFPVVAFSAYTALARQPLRIDIAFPALQLFGLLENYLRELPELITVWLNATVAIGRIEEFMREPNKDEDREKAADISELTLRNASFAWPGTSTPILTGLNLSFPYGLTVVCGEVGAGKSALLQALLGELDLINGQLLHTGEVMAYCSQSPWLETMSIRDNILFAAPFEEGRYKQVLDACALTPDFASFKHGDLSNIGENGIGLSGGQKARVALARALYSRANTILLDDPISALDHNTAESIIQKAFAGTLLVGRRIVLVTHRTELCSHFATQVIEILDGAARLISREAATAKGIHVSGTSKTEKEPNQEEEDKNKQEQEAAAVPDKFIEDEKRATGGVKMSVYWQYIKAGKLKWWAVNVIFIVAFRLVGVSRSWLFKQWGEAYDKGSASGRGLFGNLPSPEANLKPWLVLLLVIAILYAAFVLISRFVMTFIVYKTSRGMFQSVIERVTHANFRFYDVTPVGRLMNRLTSDMGTIDGNIAHQFHNFAFQAILWTMSVAIIASVTPAFLILTFLTTLTFVLIFRQFLPTSQNLRRLEMVSLSPLMTNFGALLEGLMTVRAYGAQGRFQSRNIVVVDAFQKMDHFYWILQEWLMVRYISVSALATFLLTILALYTNVSAGLAAFVLYSAATFVQTTHDICRQYGQLEMDFTSVERVVELLHLEQEPKGTTVPPAVWPSSRGDVIFEDVTIKYAPHLEPALSNVSFRIKGGSSTAIVGRTGSGKSTLALSLLATVLPTSGRILIDNIDIASIDPDVLRKRVTFLAQDPLLFEGTIRDNLDPLEEHSDDECASALDRVCGSNSLGHAIVVAESSQSASRTSQHHSTWTLSNRVEAGGRNFSQGQRQLVGLARVILRRSSVIILDEATASIDVETSMKIQQVLREEMQQSTVLTIAHRVEAVRYAEVAVVLSKGKLQEFREERATGAGASAY